MKLQRVQNSAARVFCRVSRREHIRPVLKSIHWLPVTFRIKCKICVITVNVARGHGSTYIQDMLRIKQSNYALRSADVITLEMPRMTYESLGDRAFCAAAPKECNALPKSLRANQDIT